MAICGGHEGGGTCPFCVAETPGVTSTSYARNGFNLPPDLSYDQDTDPDRAADLRWWRAKKLAELGGDAA